ncbi:serine hydrolase [Micromonospora sp. NPDC002389]|uniref:serine hydrolase domain-containing protein n=1 Tax=Micromonospora sp. NPDC002389 TaxID=3154272 RepID=UPI00332682A0
MSGQNGDSSHRRLIGPLLPASGASGVVVHRGWVVAEWGNPDRPEMLFSGTKSIVSTVAGLAFDQKLIDVHAPVADTVDHPIFTTDAAREMTWHHLLQQTSQWQGELWGKPTWVDAQSRREGTEPQGGPPGSGWAYNDVRVNLLCLALTALFRRPLPSILREQVFDQLGASTSWAWHGYSNSVIEVSGSGVPVVSGGAHWGGGIWISANDLALLGQLYLRRGRWAGRQLVSESWIDRSWQPCELNPDYGYLWWLNDRQRVQPDAPASGRCARGNLGRHLLWIDPERDLVVASHWTDDIGELVADVSAAVSVDDPPSR